QMSPHVMWLWRRRVIGIAPDVEVVAVGLESGVVHNDRKARLFLEGLKSGDDLLDVLWHQEVLRPSLEVFAVCVNEQYLALPVLRFTADPFCAVLYALAQHQNARWDASAIEKEWGHTDDGLHKIVLDHTGTDG